ncbi:MAG: EpsG family protein [Ruminiclostridium sp.]|nr:EpsG family protein [Ruminiclostridium sp.]
MDILFLLLPLILAGGIFIKKKGLCTLYCSAILFLSSAFFYSDTFFAVTTYNTDMSADSWMLSPAYVYASKLLMLIFGDYRIITVIWAFIAVSGLMLYIYKYCFYTASSAVAATLSGFWLMYFMDFTLFMGMVIAAFAFRYASEKRLIRFLSVILLASCFDLRLLILIPVYFIFFAEPTVYYIPAVLVLGAILLFVDISPVFGILLGFSPEREGAELFLPVKIIALFVITMLLMKILARRGDYNKATITLSGVSAVFALGAISDSRLLIPATACFYPAIITLGPEIVAALKSIISLTFRENKKKALIIFGSVFVISLGIFWCLLFKNSGLSLSLWLSEKAVNVI